MQATFQNGGRWLKSLMMVSAPYWRIKTEEDSLKKKNNKGALDCALRWPGGLSRVYPAFAPSQLG